MSKLVFVDCEAVGPAPSVGCLTEFGAIAYSAGVAPLEMDSFYSGRIATSWKSQPLLEWPDRFEPNRQLAATSFETFEGWLRQVGEGEPPLFVSDNPAYDWQWINDGFCLYRSSNPFGHSARRLGDFWAGLQHNWRDASGWKRHRLTAHSHHPVEDCRGNVEAFIWMLDHCKGGVR